MNDFTLKSRVISLWRLGHDTYDIAKQVSREFSIDMKEPQAHIIIMQERYERRKATGFKTIEGGRNETVCNVKS